MSERLPGLLCTERLGSSWIDDGTMCRSRSAVPGPTGLGVASMSAKDQIEEAIRRSSLGPPEDVVCGAGRWWEAHIQSYACLRRSLEGTGLHQHHLIPKSLFLSGPAPVRGLIDYVPAVTLDQSEHLSAVHGALNSFLRSKRVWQRPLTSKELETAIRFTAEFYEQHDLGHFSEAIEQFLNEVYVKAR